MKKEQNKKDELDYSLEIDLGAGGEKYLIFEDVPYGLLEEW